MNEEQERSCRHCWQFSHDACGKCGKGFCYWFSESVASVRAIECDAFNSTSRRRKHRDRNAEIFPLVEEFYSFLQGGDAPKGYSLSLRPKLTPEQAFTVIYVMQERMHILTDEIEKCDGCDSLYLSDRQGCTLSGECKGPTGRPLGKKWWGNYCDEQCLPDIEITYP